MTYRDDLRAARMRRAKAERIAAELTETVFSISLICEISRSAQRASWSPGSACPARQSAVLGL